MSLAGSLSVLDKAMGPVQPSAWLGRLTDFSESFSAASSIASSALTANVSIFASAAAGLAESMRTPLWAETAARLTDERWQAQPAADDAAQLVELADMSAWGPAVSSLTGALEDPSWLESFAGSANIEIELPSAKPHDIPAESADADSKARLLKQAVLPTVTAYLVAAVSLHLTNFLTTKNPEFDPHQFVTDEITALAFALAVFGALLPFLAGPKS
jgi:hypothetical protein